MIDVKEPKTFYLVNGTVISGEVDADSKEQAAEIYTDKYGVSNIDPDRFYDAAELYNKLGYYPEDYYLVKDGKADKFVNAKNVEDARRELGCEGDCELLTYDEFIAKYGHDPLQDCYSDPILDDREDDYLPDEDY